MKKLMQVAMVVMFALALCAGAAFGATYTNETAIGTSFGVKDAPGSYKMVGVVEFDKQAVGVAESVKVISIPAKAYVAAVAYEVTVAVTNGISVQLGDNTTTNQFCTWSGNTSTAGVAGVSAYTAAKGFTAANAINLSVNGASGNTGKVKVTATVFDLK